MMSDAPDPLELAPIEIDPRPCEHCGLTIDRHRRVDAGEGPEFFCLDPLPEDLDVDELERRDELRRLEEVAAIVRRWELADVRDRWKHTGEQPPAIVDAPPVLRKKPRVPRSTADAFKHVAALGDPDRLARWLRDHSDVAADLLKEVAEC
jgi:hypothetical protein